MDLTQLYKCRDLAIAGKWKDIENMYNKSAQIQLLGSRVDLSNPEFPQAFIDDIKNVHAGGIGSEAVNGGVIASLAELSLSLLGLSHFKEGMTATAQLTVHYLKPFRTKSISAVASTQRVVGNRIFGTVELKNDKGDVCAIAYGALAKGVSL